MKCVNARTSSGTVRYESVSYPMWYVGSYRPGGRRERCVDMGDLAGWVSNMVLYLRIR